MQIHRIHDLSNSYVNLILRKGLSKVTDENYVKNYHPEFYKEPQNLFYILNDTNGRYKKGCYYVLENDGEYICSAGWNEYDLDPSTALALTRAYVSHMHRTKYYMGEYILPKIIEATKKYENLYITADSHNSAIYQWFVRANDGKSPGMFNDWPDIYRKFKPIGKQTIYYTEQYIVKYDR